MDFCRGTYRAETRNSVCGARALWSCGHQWSSSRLHCIDSVPHANIDYRIRTSRLTTSICSTNRGRSVYGVQLCKLTISLCFVQQAPSMSTPSNIKLLLLSKSIDHAWCCSENTVAVCVLLAREMFSTLGACRAGRVGFRRNHAKDERRMQG